MEKPKLGEVVEKAWASYLNSANEVVDCLDRHFAHAKEEKQIPPFRIKKRSGAEVNISRLAEQIIAVDYKLRYVIKSLDYLMKEYKKREEKLNQNHFADAGPISEEVLFQIDVFFWFLSSALDFLGWILHLTYGTELKETDVDFVNVIRYLSRTENRGEPLFKKLKEEIDAGWLKKFFGYRHYVTHWSFIVPRYGWKWTAEAKTIEVTIFMLPDDPRASPVTYEKRVELTAYCEEVLTNTLNTIPRVLGQVLNQIPVDKT